MDTLFGLFTVLAFFKLKQPTCEQYESERTKFSLRNSVAHQQLKAITNNFRPKKQFMPKDDGGIYVGDEGDDCDEDYDEFELCDMNLTATSVATRSIKSVKSYDDNSDHKLFPLKYQHINRCEYDECEVNAEPQQLLS